LHEQGTYDDAGYGYDDRGLQLALRPGTERYPTVRLKLHKTNPLRRDGKVLVARINSGKDLKESVSKGIPLLGGLEKVISRGETALAKRNFNSPDPPPMSTDIALLRAVTELLL
jgi:hypothetical protein